MKITLSRIKIIISAFIMLAFCLLMLIEPFGNSIFAAPKIRVFLDAGHGGSDTGAIGFGYYEKTANLDIALRTKAKLEANGFEVVMRRTVDSGASLDDIVNMANSSGADLFVSIHNNAAVSPYAHGTETYWCANGVAGSNQLANLLQANLVSQTGRANRGVKTANFRVIKYTTMPAALVECAFISNQTENELLKSDDFREKCAIAIFDAIKKFSEGIIKAESGGSTSGNQSTTTTSGNQGNAYSDLSTPDSSGFTMKINTPPNGVVVSGSFDVRGWTADLRNSPAKKLAKIEIYKVPDRNAANLLGSMNTFETNVLGSQGVLNGGWSINVNCDLLAEGENIIYIYCFDEAGNFSIGNVRVNVLKSGTVPENLNLNPIAKPGGPYESNLGTDIAFDGSKSFDPDGTIAAYTWDFGDGTNASEAKPIHKYEKAGKYNVTLTVKDNQGKSSAAATTTVTVTDPAAQTTDTTADTTQQTSPDTQPESVSNTTNMTGYIEVPESALLKIFSDRNSSQMERAVRLTPLYIKYGKLFNIRADIAWAQMCHETAFLQFTGDVKPGQNNFCGLGATGGGAPGNSFATEELGVIAHYAHLAWYFYLSDVNEYCTKSYDPRHFGTTHINYTGNTTLGFLNGRWAPGATYTDKIILFANQVLQAMATGSIAANTQQTSVTANAGPDISGNVGDNLTFDASASLIKATGDITVNYAWDWNGDGAHDQTVNTAVVKHVFESYGMFEVSLKVSLSNGTESTDKVKVSINSIPSADAGGPYAGKAGTAIVFDGSKSKDSDGTIKDFLWEYGDGSTGTGAKPSHTYNTAGTYTVKLTVVDDKNVSSTTVNVSAEIAPQEETTAISSTETSGSSGSSDSSGTTSSASTTTDTSGTGTNTQGSNVNTSTTETSTTTETTVANKPPVAQAGGPYSGNAGQNITFNGSASSDEDGEIKEYSWDFGDGTAITNGKMPTHSYEKAGSYTVKLKVKDDDGAISEEASAAVSVNQVEVQPQYPVNSTIITNSTSIIGYTEVTVDQLVSLFVARNSTKVDWARRLALIYIQYGKVFNIRADVAWAQMCHETGFLEYTGDVKPEQNNFCGLGATGGGVPGNSFATEELGIIAHYAHLAWYFYPSHVNQYCTTTYDPRHFGTGHYKYTGDTSIGFLNGRWAPGATYTDKILLYSNKIYGF
jgi:N-acetylmuramoyl-L-alanine amidase/PKD repeat protein